MDTVVISSKHNTLYVKKGRLFTGSTYDIAFDESISGNATLRLYFVPTTIDNAVCVAETVRDASTSTTTLALTSTQWHTVFEANGHAETMHLKGVLYNEEGDIVADGTVVVTMSPTKAVYNGKPVDVVGPKGDKGERGDNGKDGEKGEKGDKGNKGDQGPQGIKGADGVIYTPTLRSTSDGVYVDWTDSNGTTVSGTVNIRGIQGIQGPEGKQGIQGERGIAGKDGEKGEKGDVGKDAYAIALDAGYKGTREEYLALLAATAELPAIKTAVETLAATVSGQAEVIAKAQSETLKATVQSRSAAAEAKEAAKSVAGELKKAQTAATQANNAAKRAEEAAEEGGKIKIDTALSATSTNPVQNKVVKAALDGKSPTSHAHTQYADKTYFNSDNTGLPYVENYAANTNKLRMILVGGNWNDFGSNNFDEAILRFQWLFQYDSTKPPLETLDVPMSAFKNLVNGGGGNTEVWKGNVGFGEQDTFFAAKKTADGDGQFLNGYPRLHNHGQDIHEVSGFSRDSREDETVWSHRLLLPWDLAKANDTSYLMAAVIWESTRLGVNCKFVQPLLPTNTPEATSTLGLPYALPCFENSPIYWNGHLIFDDGSSVKQIKFPWGGIQYGGTSKIPVISGGAGSMAINDDDGNYLCIYADGSGGYIHTNGMTTSPNQFSFVTKALLDRISALESGLRYSIVKAPFATGVLTLADRAVNVAGTYVGSIVVNVPTKVSGKVRYFILDLTTSAELAMDFFGVTLLPRDGDEDNLVPEVGRNIFMFTEISEDVFLVSRTLVTAGGAE